MAMSIRSLALRLPKVSARRTPLVALINSHSVSTSFVNSLQSNNFSTIPPCNDKSNSWSDAAIEAANNLEKSANKLAGTVESATKEYLHEVNRFSNEEDEILKDLSVAMSNEKNIDLKSKKASTTFEETFSDEVHDHVHPSKPNKDIEHHSEMITSLLNEFKKENSESKLSQHASNAIQMAGTKNVLKHDKNPIHDVGNVDSDVKSIHGQY